MALQVVVGNARESARTVRDDVLAYVQRRRAKMPALAREEQQLVEELRAKGYAVVPGYMPRTAALALRDRLEPFLAEGTNRDFTSGAYLRFWDNRSYDEGVRRLYHVDREIPELADYRDDEMIQRVVSAYYGVPFHSGTLVFQHNTRSNANTRYYHVDAFSKEFKSFLYLDDVDDGNGPFAYIPNTQRAHLRRILRQLRKGSAATGFAPEELGSFVDREVRITGAAGTLILADVRGFHRGTPQVERSRSVVVNYMYPHPGEVSIDR